ncbi:MAG: hypothetical protein MPJ22_00110 [Pirellulales bacterium]|nr:hypothetical protein [Pirellulales bacterium]
MASRPSPAGLDTIKEPPPPTRPRMVSHNDVGLDFILKAYSQVVDTAEHKGLVNIDRKDLQWQLLNADVDNLPAFIRALVNLNDAGGTIQSSMTPVTASIIRQSIEAIIHGYETGVKGLNSKDGFMIQKMLSPTQKYEYKGGGMDEPGALRKIFNKDQGSE